jgi:lipopolysaccharide assembly outer membrane protein LptD (OstA)
MKLLAMAVCVACVPAFAQNLDLRCFGVVLGPAANNFHVAGCTPEREAQIRQTIKIKNAIAFHRSFDLPNTQPGAAATATAADLKDDGRVLTLTGVEITTGTIAVTADELIYHWDTHQIELRGNVQLKPSA